MLKSKKNTSYSKSTLDRLKRQFFTLKLLKTINKNIFHSKTIHIHNALQLQKNIFVVKFEEI